MYLDAHNHLQDPRLATRLPEIIAECRAAGVTRMVVNGSGEEDWPAVLELARRHPFVLPSFGVHPWYVREQSPRWRSVLLEHLAAAPSAVGETGLDRWVPDHDLPLQEGFFREQLAIAAERNLPVTIHCLKAWGRLLELLRADPRPRRGFLLHSYGGPVELVEPLAGLGAYFSLSGYFAHERKARQREAFRAVPPDRLLIETDAPDMWPPDPVNRFPLMNPADGRPLNHPANLSAVYDWAARFLGEDPAVFATRVAENFDRLFGGLTAGNKCPGIPPSE